MTTNLQPKQLQAIAVMNQCIRAGKRDPRIRSLANRIVRRIPEGKFRDEIRAVVRAIKNRVRYSRDPYRVETISDAWDTWVCGYGDCDDLSVLVSSMLQTLGHPTRLRLVGKDRYSHVLVDVQVPGRGWRPVDLARPRHRVFDIKRYPLNLPLASSGHDGGFNLKGDYRHAH